MIDLKVAITKEQLDELSECGVNGIQASVGSYGCTMTVGSHETKDEHVNVKIERKNPKPRTKTTYEKVTESIFDLKHEFELGCLYVELLGNSGDYTEIEEESVFIDEFRDDNVYRRVETEIGERQEFIDGLSCTLKNLNPETLKQMDYISAALYDLGYRLTDKPEGL